MNLLGDIFDIDKIKIMEVNRKYMITLIMLSFIIISLLLFVKKNYYYINTITNVGDNVLLVAEKEMVNNIKNSKKIIINGTISNYSINRIEQLQEVCFIYVNLDNKNIDGNTYKIYLGKESILEFIIRILKK